MSMKIRENRNLQEESIEAVTQHDLNNADSAFRRYADFLCGKFKSYKEKEAIQR